MTDFNLYAVYITRVPAVTKFFVFSSWGIRLHTARL